MNDHDYSTDFNDDSFWSKLARYARAIGREVVEKALSMYYALQDKDTPLMAKGVIVGALGYLIFPGDAIPDIIPGAGFADDAGAVAAAFSIVAMHIKPEHKERAKQKANEWFGSND